MPENLRFSQPDGGREKRDIRPATSERFAALAGRVIPEPLGDHTYVERQLGRWTFTTSRTRVPDLPDTESVTHEAAAFWRLSAGTVTVAGVPEPVNVDYVMEVSITSEGILKLERPQREGYIGTTEFFNSELPEASEAELSEVDRFARQALTQYGLPMSADPILPYDLYELQQTADDTKFAYMSESPFVLAQRILSDEQLNQAIDYLEQFVNGAQGNPTRS